MIQETHSLGYKYETHNKNWWQQHVPFSWSVYVLWPCFVTYLAVCAIAYTTFTLNSNAPYISKRLACRKHFYVQTGKSNSTNKTLEWAGDDSGGLIPAPYSTFPYVIGSYNEFQKRMHSVPKHFKSVDISINLTNSSDWPNDMPLLNAHLISKITFQGQFDVNNIIYIIKEARFAQVVRIINSKNGICQHNKIRKSVIQFNSPIILQSVQELHYEGFNLCNEIFDRLSSIILLPNLKSFSFSKGVIDANNAESFVHFLKLTKNSVQNLFFVETNWNAFLFTNNFPIFPLVSIIHIEFITDTPGEPVYFSKRFHEKFPLLSEFSSTIGRITSRQLSVLLECRHLRKLTVNVISDNSTHTNLNLLRNAYPLLRQADISLYFPNKTGRDICGVQGIAAVKKRMNLTVRANCKVVEVYDVSHFS